MTVYPKCIHPGRSGPRREALEVGAASDGAHGAARLAGPFTGRDDYPRSPARRFLRGRGSVYSIQYRSVAGTPCALCGTPTGMGPVGHWDDEPICDRCLFERSTDLGMVLALVAITRTFAGEVERRPESWDEALKDLGAFAQIFGHVVKRWGPPRWFDVSGKEPS
ncbi:MAG: hypothetical protein AAGD06_32525 [Acidobacteriota bacterium]